jgi:hypothetical protein
MPHHESPLIFCGFDLSALRDSGEDIVGEIGHIKANHIWEHFDQVKVERRLYTGQHRFLPFDFLVWQHWDLISIKY